MLSGLTFGDRSALEQQHLAEARAAAKKEKKKKHKKEKSKKHKKDKSKKQQKRDSSPSGSEPSSGSGSEDEWQNQQQQQGSSPDRHGRGNSSELDGAAAKAQREDWMTVPMASSLFEQPEKPAAETKAAEPEEAPIVAGIRYMKPEQAAAAAERAAAREAAAAAAAPPAGAAGVSWRVRALQRAQQLAKDQGRGLNEVLSERWGSAAEIAKGIIDSSAAAAVEGSTEQQHSRADRQRSERDSSSRGAPAAHYLSSLRSERAEMKRPAGIGSSNKLSWRRQGSTAAAAAGDGSSRGVGDRAQAEQQRDDRRTDRRREWDRDGERDEEGSRQRERQHTDRGREAERSRNDDGDSRHHLRDGDRAHDSRGRGSSRYDSRDSRDNHHGRSRDRGRGDRGVQPGREPGRGSWQQQQGQQQQQQQAVEALKAIAGSINTFQNDGSFMDHLASQQQQQQEDRGGGSSSMEGAAAAGSSSDEEQQQRGRQRNGSGERIAAPAESPPRAAAAAPGASNRSTAELLRARLAGKTAAAPADAGGGGNRSVAEALRARLAGKAPAAAAAAGSDSGNGKREVVVLPQVDASGRAMPGAFGREAAGAAKRAAEVAAGGRLNKKVQRYGSDGTRERYFADDDNVDLQTLVKRAKHGDDVMDIDRAMASNIAHKARFKETDLDADAEYDYDAGLELTESRRKRGTVEQQQSRERQRQVAQFNKFQRLEDSCTYCFTSKARPKELAIAVGQYTYLSLVQRGRLVEGHCAIVPAEHVASTRQVDEATWTEVRNFQKCLIRMFMEQGKEVLFLETATGLGSHKNHAIMEAIPMDADAFGKAPMYFKKALQEAESEWSQHAAKAVIDTKAKGLRGSIPPNFPYLYVQFGYANGFVHVIDDESKFDRQLGRQVVVGLLKLPPEVMHRRQRSDAPQVQASMAAGLRKQFSPYDWTKALD